MLEVNKLIEEANNAINWIKNYVEETGAKGVVVGNSGGKDSATVIAMATKALGKEHVVTVAMPCNSVSTDLDDAQLVADTFDVPFLKVDLSETYADMEDTINTALCDIKTELNKESKNIEIYRTDELGTIKTISDGNNIKITYEDTNTDG